MIKTVILDEVRRRSSVVFVLASSRSNGAPGPNLAGLDTPRDTRPIYYGGHFRHGTLMSKGHRPADGRALFTTTCLLCPAAATVSLGARSKRPPGPIGPHRAPFCLPPSKPPSDVVHI